MGQKQKLLWVEYALTSEKVTDFFEIEQIIYYFKTEYHQTTSYPIPRIPQIFLGLRSILHEKGNFIIAYH